MLECAKDGIVASSQDGARGEVSVPYNLSHLFSPFDFRSLKSKTVGKKCTGQSQRVNSIVMFSSFCFNDFPKLFLVNLPVEVSRGLGRTLKHLTEAIFK